MNNLKAKMAKLGLDPKRELTLLFATDAMLILLGVLAYFFLNQSMILLGCVAGSALFTIFYLSRYSSKLTELDMKLTDQFVESFTYFSIYIANDFNVYNALSEVAELAKKEVSPLFRDLLEAIDLDKTVEPFLRFAANFRSLEVKQVMLSVYQLVEEGGRDSHISQFSTLFSKFSEERHKLERERRRGKLESLSVLPLIGSALTMLSLVIALVEIMGELYNVL